MPGTILLADDEEKILKTLGRALRDDGHDVVTTARADQALKLLGERPFDLLIVDYLMPERTGLDVIPPGRAVTVATSLGPFDSADALRYVKWKVERVELGEGTDIDDPRMQQCLQDAMYSVTFDPPKDGGSVQVTYPLTFEPG